MSTISNRTEQSNNLSFAADLQPSETASEVSFTSNETMPVGFERQSSAARYYSRTGIDTAQQSRAFFESKIAANDAVSSNSNAVSNLNLHFLKSLGSLELKGASDGGIKTSLRKAKSDAHRITPELKAKFELIGKKYNLSPALLAGIASRESNIGGEFGSNKHKPHYGWGDHGRAAGIMQIDKFTAAIPNAEKRELQAAYRNNENLDPFSLKNIEQGAREFKNKLHIAEHRFPKLSSEAQTATAISLYNGGDQHAWPHSDQGTTSGDYANDTLIRARYYAKNWDKLADGKTATLNEPTATDTPVSTPANPTANSTANALLSRGQSGDAVRQLQQNLMKLGQMNIAQVRTGVGVFGPRTQSAVAAFQQNVGLPVTGGLDAATGKVMNAILSAVKRGDNSNPKLIEQVQNKLVEAGYLTREQIGGNAGTFGPRTEAALKKFQADHNLPQTGRFGRLTYNALFNSNPAVVNSTSGAKQTVTASSPNRTTVSSAPTNFNKSNGLPTTTEEANKFFKTQFRTKWNPTGPNSSADCGPASLEMALETVGVRNSSHKQESINQARVFMHAAKTGGTNYLQIKAGAQEAGAHAEIQSGWDKLDSALANGKAVVVNGKHFAAYRQAFGNYRHAKGDGPGHFIAILGRDKQGRYIVADPLNDTGTVAFTRAQLQPFFAEKESHAPYHIVVIGRKD